MNQAAPHSAEAERGVLGSILLSPRQVIPECIEKINPAHFHVPALQTIYSVLVDLWNAGHAIDLITVTQKLRDRHLLESVGGPGFVTSLLNFVPTATNVQYYIDIAREKRALRRHVRNPHPSQIVATALLTKPELARELRVSVRTIDNMMAQRMIPFIRTRRAVRFCLPRACCKHWDDSRFGRPGDDRVR